MEQPDDLFRQLVESRLQFRTYQSKSYLSDQILLPMIALRAGQPG